MARASLALSAAIAVALTSGCKTIDNAGGAVKSVGNTVASTAGDAARGAVSLVNVDLSNVLNDLSLDLDIDKANIPINAQIPITLAANICGVSINILSVSTGGSPNCTARSTSPELSQAVQQQMAANGSVGGGSQSGSSATGASGSGTPAGTTTTAPGASGSTTSPTATGGVTGTTSGTTNTGTSGTTTNGQPSTGATTQ